MSLFCLGLLLLFRCHKSSNWLISPWESTNCIFYSNSCWSKPDRIDLIYKSESLLWINFAPFVAFCFVQNFRWFPTMDHFKTCASFEPSASFANVFVDFSFTRLCPNLRLYCPSKPIFFDCGHSWGVCFLWNVLAGSSLLISSYFHMAVTYMQISHGVCWMLMLLML